MLNYCFMNIIVQNNVKQMFFTVTLSNCHQQYCLFNPFNYSRAPCLVTSGSTSGSASDSTLSSSSDSTKGSTSDSTSDSTVDAECALLTGYSPRRTSGRFFHQYNFI